MFQTSPKFRSRTGPIYLISRPDLTVNITRSKTEQIEDWIVRIDEVQIFFNGFPSNPEDKERWNKNSPYLFTCEITLGICAKHKTLGICAKHWPPDCPKNKARGGFLIPTVPPSIFGETNRTYFSKSLVRPSRNI